MDNLIFKNFFPVLLILAISSCAITPSNSDSSAKIAYKETGKASFYADKFQGRKTASGERFNQSAYTAAHRKLPFGTKVKVTNLKNGKTVTVKINDRGPYARGRIIDLSRSAFNAIGNTSKGVIDVRIEIAK